MAVDTRDKRASCLMLGLPFARLLDNPDNSVDAPERLQTSFLYSGIAAESPPGTGQPAKKRGYFVPGMYTQPSIFGPKAAT